MSPPLIARAARTVARTGTRVCASSLFIFAALAWLASPAHARDDYPRRGWIDATDYTISLTIPEAGDEIRAETTIAFRLKSNDPRELPLDFGSLTVDSVTVNERATGFKHEGERLLVSLASGYRNGDILRVSVKYHGRPSDGLFFKRNKFGERTIFADNWPNRAHHWFPSIDHPYDKAKVTFVVTAPARYGVVANGSLFQTNAGPNGTRIFIWRESIEIPVYCMVIGVTEFSVVDAGSFDAKRLSYYLYPKDRDNGIHDYGRALRAADYLRSIIGPYPYEKLALVESSTRFGGMENSSSIFFDENAYDGSGRLEGTVAHEIAHQWFGDSVTEKDWNHLWLSEGFATYFGALFFEHADGRARFLEVMRGARDRYVNDSDAVARPIYDPTEKDLFKLLNRNNYEKGAWVLHMLRYVMGDKKFFEGIRDYYQTFRDGNADTQDFQRVMERHYGRTLYWFFHQWIDEPGFPVYVVRWAWIDRMDQTCVNVVQVRHEAFYRMPLVVELKTGSEVRRETVEPKQPDQVFCFNQRSKPQSVSVDPDEWVLKTMTLEEETQRRFRAPSKKL
ncbi:MAG: M1 family metallopeptidase [Pyrinomonadaceae bacterium]